MKVFFEQHESIDHKEPGWYRVEVLPGFPIMQGGTIVFISYPDSYCKRISFRVHRSERDKLNEMISELFESVNIDNRSCDISDVAAYTVYYKFEDPADEAFFLVWSPDGIEI